ncbi:MAG: helix-turn-helix transcriptional regulator [Prosthecobacter sp.]|jgi:AraC-like DNA-binding protein|uniref:helix-turn-helix domain-containing protein n=1 Tax=Prosthecobacter sp. TaxID=1965333 RepID=UPI001A08ED20|nr:AraC family transcriptional regulator [Prosthecobacter sp.]MBE2283850.1 helix-turn-helix transcriptional regulator [Prosthecobacter sp.]
MKPVFEKVPKRQWESFHCEVVHGPDYGTRWHFHPEYQLTLAIESRGHRVVGDNIGTLSDGDIVLLGSNLPHVWHQDRGPKARQVSAIIVRFDETFLGRDFFTLPEVEPVKRLLQRAARGLEVRGNTRTAVTDHMKRLAQSEGLARVIELLAILNTLANSTELKPLASASYEPKLESADQGRMERVVDFIHTHLTEEIDRERLAKLAHLSLGAFSRFFHSRTGKTVPEYVNEVRIGRACRMLAEDAGNITDIAMDCGYRNLANFNRRFREVMGTTPSAYRQKFRGVAGQ